MRSPIGVTLGKVFRQNSQKIVILSAGLHRWIACHSAYRRGVEEPVLSVAEGTPTLLFRHAFRSFPPTEAREQDPPWYAPWSRVHPCMRCDTQQIEERVSALPNVKAASFSAFTFHEGSWGSSVVVPGTNIGENVGVKHNVVGDGYLATMQIPLLAGRNFSPSDTRTSQHVAIISEHTAKVLFPLRNPLGRHYGLGDDKPQNDVTVIGIAKDVKFGDLTEEPVNIDYFPYHSSRKSPGQQHALCGPRHGSHGKRCRSR